MKTDTVLVSSQSAVQERANVVRASLAKANGAIEDGYFDLCDLLCEAQEGSYNHVWGFERFQDWVEQASGLDMSGRQAYYLIQISKKAKELGLSREQLKLIKISKLKAIFSLDSTEFAAQIKTLIEEAPGLSLEEITNRVRSLKGQGETVYMTLKIEKSVKETVDKALELARRNYGSVMLGHDATDISVSQCVELIAVSYVQDPNNNPDNQDIAEDQE